MRDLAETVPGFLVTDVHDIDQEFEARLQDSASLAFRVAFSVLRHHQDAEDVAQEAFARAYKGFAQLRDREAFRAWLVRMTWRLALDHLRGHRRRTAREQTPIDPPIVPSGEQQAIDADRARRLWEAIDRLPEVLRLTLVLSSIHEHSMKEVAALTGAPEGTVKSRVFDAKKLLKEMLT
ncbi:MAG TPA: RNA polymerase sigma factor [Vicinamibacterales bacterium]|nr:RNA polymerase sigma factor [Vicinamibacterales bacterium]